jgi:hypothetical protein
MRNFIAVGVAAISIFLLAPVCPGCLGGTITVVGMHPATGPHFTLFAQRNSGKYLSCGDLLIKVMFADGSVRGSPAYGDINQGVCHFDVDLGGTKSPVRSIGVYNKLGVLIGLLQPGLGSRRPGGQKNTQELMQFNFTFQKIVLENKIGKKAATDDWNASP